MAKISTETDKSEDFYGFKLPDPSGDEEDGEVNEEVWIPLLVSVTRSEQRSVTELQDEQCRRFIIPKLLSSNAVTRIRGAAQWCPGGPNSPIEL